MPQVQEIPQDPILTGMFQGKPIQPVSVFQGYNPQTMAQVEGPQQGGWVPLMQDPITMGALGGGGAAVAGVPGMFAQLAQMYGPQMVPAASMGQPSIMSGYRPGWQKIPNTTEPDLGSGRTEWASPVSVMGPRTGPEGRTGGDLGIQPYRISRETNPFPYTPDPSGGGWTRVGSGGEPDVPDPRPNYADIRQQFAGPSTPTRIPVTTSSEDYMNPNVRIPSRNVPELLQRMASPQGLTVGGALVPIPEEQPLRITTPGGQVIMSSGGVGVAGGPGIPVRRTDPLSNVFITSEGHAPAPVWTGGRATGDLPSLSDLFKEFPE